MQRGNTKFTLGCHAVFFISITRKLEAPGLPVKAFLAFSLI